MPYTQRERLPNRRRLERIAATFGGQKVHVDLGRYEDGRLAEVFIVMDQTEGADLRVLMNDLAVLLSIALQHGVDPMLLARALRGSRFGPHGPTDDERIPEATSVTDYVAQLIELQPGNPAK